MNIECKVGLPSKEKPWLKYYEKDVWERATSIPSNKTIWDVIEESLYKYIDIPAIEYFGKVTTRKEFIAEVYEWAKAFKALGVKENEIVSYYGPFLPDTASMIFAMNMIGACPYFLKLAIGSEALAQETKDSHIAIVFDEMWENVKKEFSKDRFEKILVMSATDAEIIIPKGEKYIPLKKAKKYADTYEGDLKVDFIPGRPAFITSSSGTTVGGIVKGTVATNESVISQLYMGCASGTQYYPGDRCLNHFPPTASTSLNGLFLMALYNGETVVIDPRVTEDDFYYQITKLKPNVAVSTGSIWEAVFDRIERELDSGKKFDFSHARGWVIGGEGTDTHKVLKWNEIMKRTKAPNLLFNGYGCSEVFSAATEETVSARCDYSKQIMSVGIPYAGMTMGVFDKNGAELSYNKRGELRIKSNSSMKEYYGKPDYTAEVIKDGWICTGDLAEIDENGFVYIWGRISDKAVLADGKEVFLFDIANKIKEKEYIDDAIVLEKPAEQGNVNLVAHIVWDKSVEEKDIVGYLQEINEDIKNFEPEINLCAYAFHDVMLPYSPTTLKKDKNKMSKQIDGYVQVENGELEKVKFLYCD